MSEATITEQNFPEFKHKFEQAKEEGEESFMFEDQEVLVAYAEHVVIYIEDELREKRK